jgi:hypothetical protein
MWNPDANSSRKTLWMSATWTSDARFAGDFSASADYPV